MLQTVVRRVGNSVKSPKHKGLDRQMRRYDAGSHASKNLSDEDWQKRLTTTEYHVLREKGTEAPHKGEYTKNKDKGEYECKGCGLVLYKSDMKFDSGCGWPAFFEEVEGTVDRNVDVSHGMKRTEIVCHRCGGHLGHVFEGEGFGGAKDERHCVNSCSLKFNKK